jgi:hypothetical protein
VLKAATPVATVVVANHLAATPVVAITSQPTKSLSRPSLFLPLQPSLIQGPHHDQ